MKFFDITQEMIDASRSGADLLKKLGRKADHASYRILRRSLEGLDTSKWLQKAKVSDEELLGAVPNVRTASELLRAVGLDPHGSAHHRRVKRLLRKNDIDTSHWTPNAITKPDAKQGGKAAPLEEILVVESSYGNTNSLKKRLLKNGILSPKCAKCGLDSWLGEPISLQLEHRNGVHSDNRVDNLQLLCPNCHSQTPTYAGRNKGRKYVDH